MSTNKNNDKSTDPARTAQKVEEKAGEIQVAAKNQAADVLETAKARGDELARETGEAVRQKAGEAKSSLRKVAEERREQAAGKVSDYQRAAKAAATKLKEEDDELLSDHLETLSGKLGDVSNYLSGKGIDELAGDAGEFTRKNPEIVLGATVLAGFALARFLKTSSRSRQDDRLPSHYSQAGRRRYRNVSNATSNA